VSDALYLERARRNIEWLRTHYPGHIHGENLNYFPTGAYERVCDPDFIWQVVEVTGIGLLLDVAHAVISAHYLGYKEPWSYIDRLPLGHVREAHISHCSTVDGILEDLHEIPGEVELSLMKRIIGTGHKIQYLTIEYYRKADALCSAYRSIGQALGIASERASIEDSRATTSLREE
jgi:uncharacterized protein (UPF0276 family)